MGFGGIGRWRPLALRIFFSLISIIMVLVLIASVNFAIFLTHGDEGWLIPKGIQGELEDVVREELRLDEHVVVRYFDYLVSTFTGDFYTSTGVRKFADVESLIYHNVLGTIFLLAIVSTASVLLGMAWGSCMKKNAGRAYGKILHVLAVSSLSIPVSWLLMSLWMTSDYLDLRLSVWGNGFDGGAVETLRHAILPIMSTMAAGSGFFALVTRSGLLRAERLGEETPPFTSLDYVDPFPYFLFPLVMIGILNVDMMYSYDGLGTLAWDALLYRDVPVLMACFFVISAIVFFSQLVFRAVRERSRFMRPIDGILGPSEGTRSQEAADLRPERQDRLSISLLVSRSKHVAGAYMRHKSGVAAVIVLAIILALGLFAPILSTVQDPNLTDNYEPSIFDEDGNPISMNPLPPSLTPSPYTGMIHPLGTDHKGQDIYSMNLYAAGTGIAIVLSIGAISLLCGLFVGFLSIVSVHYTGLLSKLRRCSTAIVSLAFLAILAPLIPIFLLRSPYHDQAPPILFLLILSIYCWVYRMITWPLSNSLRSVSGARRWNEMGRTLRDSVSLFRCYSPLVLSKTLHITKYVVLVVVFYSSFWHFVGWLNPFDTVLSWDLLLESAYSYGAFYRGHWWWTVPPLLGIVALAVSSYFFVETLEKVFDEHVGFRTSSEQSEEVAPGSDGDAKEEQGGAELDTPTSTTGPPN